MLQIRDLVKAYRSGEQTYTVLHHLNLAFRRNEFAVISGPSGSGKTTLLNILGGLDHCDSGELSIDGISTANYKEKDWGFYRNRRVGFIFQFYNLIPHQTVLSNVELAMTISGVSRKQRRERAMQVLEQVGLTEHIQKHPNELSGGQMQRVAIARALVNDPDILLADEPTGSLDSATSQQIASLLQQIAEERLVIMVTHNTELAEKYATRSIVLKDGAVISDSNPYTPQAKDAPKPIQPVKIRLGFFTSLMLSFHNLRSKKSRTLFTVIAGSIGIWGIALILALATGMNDYISGFRQRTMMTYPVTLQSESFEVENLFNLRTALVGDRQKYKDRGNNQIYADSSAIKAQATVSSATVENDLSAFKAYLDDPGSNIHQYIGEKGIVYQYHVNFSVYSYDSNGWIVRSDADVGDMGKTDGVVDMIGSAGGLVNGFSQLFSNDIAGAENFSQLAPGADGALVNQAVLDNYELLTGSWPTEYNEVLLVLDRNNALDTHVLYQLGLISQSQYRQITECIETGGRMDALYIDPQAACSHTFYLVPACDTYEATENGIFRYIGDNSTRIGELLERAIPLKVCGVIRPIKTAEHAEITTAVAYTAKLTDYLIGYIESSAVVQAQQADPNHNILTGIPFSAENQEQKIQNARTCISLLHPEQKAAVYDILAPYRAEETIANLTDSEKCADIDLWLSTAEADPVLLLFYGSYLSGCDYEANLLSFGLIDYDHPAAISLYADDFAGKEGIVQCIDEYNHSVPWMQRIHYTDYVNLITASIRSVMDVIIAVLIAFVAISLIVSSVMIGIITSISVRERTREIGILRALGTSRWNVCSIFNAENIIIGFSAGLFGVGITYLLQAPINKLLASVLNTESLCARLPLGAAAILVAISIVITLLGGMIPALRTAKTDPALTMRTE